MFLISSCSCLCPIHWSQVLSREWRCSWSNADRRCSNYIWVINKFIAYGGVTHIRGLTVLAEGTMQLTRQSRVSTNCNLSSSLITASLYSIVCYIWSCHDGAWMWMNMIANAHTKAKSREKLITWFHMGNHTGMFMEPFHKLFMSP